MFSIGLSMRYLISRGILSNEDRFDDISELIKIGVVPVLTLVVGIILVQNANNTNLQNHRLVIASAAKQSRIRSVDSGLLRRLRLLGRN